MTKKVLSILAIAASLFSCTKEISENGITEEIVGSKLIVRATNPETKLTFTENGTGGYSLTFQDETDHLWGYFRKGAEMLNYTDKEGKTASRMFMPLDESTLKNANKSASFTSDCLQIPAEATNIFFYMDNNVTPITYNSTPTFCDLKEQSGRLEDANLLHVIVGHADIASMTKDGEGNYIADVDFEYKTSLIKFEITFPDGVVPTADESTEITIDNTTPALKNKVHISWGEPGSSTETGPIKFHPASVSGQVATAYITVWEGTVFDSAPLQAKVDGKICSVSVNAAKTIEAGKVYRLRRDLVISAYDNVDKWTSDDAASINYEKGKTAESTPAGMSYDSTTGVVAWDANTSGSPKVRTLTFEDGKTIKITQIEAKDFAGSWKLTADTRVPGSHGSAIKATSTSAGTGGNPVGYAGTLSGKKSGSWYDETWTAPGSGAGTKTNLTITYTGAENQLNIAGLIDGLNMPAKVVISYASKSVSFQPYIENKSYLQGTGTAYEGEYLAFATELRNVNNAVSNGKTINQPWQLGFGNGGSFYFPCPTVISDGGITASFSGTAMCTAYPLYNVVGLLVNRYKASATSGANLIRSQKSVYAYTQADQGGAAYAKVFQGGMTFVKD